MNKRFIKSFRPLGVVAALAAVSSAHAAPIVVTDVVTEIANAITPIGLIGSGVLLVIVAIKAFKWVRTAM